MQDGALAIATYVSIGATGAPVFSNGGGGLPWLLGSERLLGHQTAFLRRCPGYVARMRRGHALLHNWVDERNAVSRRWLAWLDRRGLPPLAELAEPELRLAGVRINHNLHLTVTPVRITR